MKTAASGRSKGRYWRQRHAADQVDEGEKMMALTVFDGQALMVEGIGKGKRCGRLKLSGENLERCRSHRAKKGRLLEKGMVASRLWTDRPYLSCPSLVSSRSVEKPLSAAVPGRRRGLMCLITSKPSTTHGEDIQRWSTSVLYSLRKRDQLGLVPTETAAAQFSPNNVALGFERANPKTITATNWSP